MNFNRRQFLTQAALFSAGLALPKAIKAQTAAPRVLVIGGGFGGATVAKYLKLWGGNLDVTLIDRNPNHYACILSNLVVTGALKIDRIRLGYENLQSKRGVRFEQGEALAVDPDAKEVTIQIGSTRYAYSYDKLVLSPGVDFINPNGNYNPDLTPHAWKAGPQTLLLNKMLSSMKAKQTYVLTIPKSP
ncbi:MAG: FAD-dependent oxidoreductase, partial [Verrucomicrobiae bacterium]|nr:FAD-dependent oxidoreductase [Verrucomicrobiae bacterium]